MHTALLFDIDGTLLQARGLGTLAFQETFQEILGTTIDMQHVNWQGATDGEVIQSLLLDQGLNLEQTQSIRPRLFELYSQNFAKQKQKHPDRIQAIQGAAGVLDALRDQPRGILTGNIRATAHTKLQGAQMDHYFPEGIGAYGCDSDQREELYPFALRRLNQHYKNTIQKAIIIGDSPRDIQVAQHHGVPVIAMATGRSSSAQLAAHNPDYLFEDYSRQQKILAVIYGLLETH